MFSFHFRAVKLGKSDEISGRFPNSWHLLLWSLNPGVNVLVYVGLSSVLTMSGISSVPPPLCILAMPAGWGTICSYINFGKGSIASVQIPQHIHNVEPTDVTVVLLVRLLWNPRGKEMLGGGLCCWKGEYVLFLVGWLVSVWFGLSFLLVISTEQENSSLSFAFGYKAYENSVQLKLYLVCLSQ